jgi:hypothetical protein
MGLEGVDFLWWHDATDRMALRAGGTSHSGTTSAFPLDSEWHRIGFSFANGTAWDNVSGYVDGVKVLDDTPDGDFGVEANPFRIGAASAGLSHENSYAIAACWDRYLTETEHELLNDDPFGLLRRGIAMLPVADGPTLQSIIYPTSDIAATGWDSAPTPSQDLWAQVDEVVASDTDYIFTEDPNP